MSMAVAKAPRLTPSHCDVCCAELDAVGQVVGKARPADAEPLRCASVKSNIGYERLAVHIP